MPNSVSLPTPLILAALFIAPFLFGRTLTAARQSSVDTVITVDRRSVMKYKGKASEEVIQKALLAAIHAPNHWLNEPWRFYRLGPESRGKLGELNPDKAAVFAGVPDMFVVTVVPSMAMKTHSMDDAKQAWDGSWGKCALEDHAATAAAIQNLMLSLAASGVGSKWMTGAMGIAPDKLLQLVDAEPNQEHMMGVIFVGVPAKPTKTMSAPKRKKGLEGGIVSFCE